MSEQDKIKEVLAKIVRNYKLSRKCKEVPKRIVYESNEDYDLKTKKDESI